MIKFTKLFLLLLICSCTNTDTSDQVISEEVTEPQLIEDSFLKKANASLMKIAQKDFEAIPYNDAKFRDSKTLCEQSKGYNEDIWEGLNECSWAVEKERIQQYENLVSRNGDLLILKTNKGALSLEHKSSNQELLSYFQFKSYIKNANYYLVEEIIDGACTNSKLISFEDGSDYPLKGSIIFANDGEHFLVFNNQKILNNCPNKLELYRLNQTGLTKLWHIPLKSKKVKSLKFPSPKEVYISLVADKKTLPSEEYIKITL